MRAKKCARHARIHRVVPVVERVVLHSFCRSAVAGDRIDRVVKAQAEVRGIDVDRMRQSFVERSPLRRMSTAEDIASLAAFLCSDFARNISGQVVPVTAGEPAS